MMRSYFNNPPCAYGPGGDWGAPVPGWGVNPAIAGPRRVGVGADVFKFDWSKPKQPTTTKELPWWVWPAGALAIGAVIAVLTHKR